MDKVEAIEAIEVLKAYCDGKEIEVADKGIGNWGKCSSDEPYFNFASFNYRIKPTEEFRPYKDCDEMIEDFASRFHPLSLYSCALPLIWVRNKQYGTKSLVTDYEVNCIILSNTSVTLDDLYKYYEYLDGSTIGVKL